LREIAQRLRQHAKTLHTFDMRAEARQLKEIASDCESGAANILAEDRPEQDHKDDTFFRPRADDVWIIRRKTKDVEQRSYVIDLSLTTQRIFKKSLYSTLATVTNVIFIGANITASEVREFLRFTPGD
jgi:hypothetical protein